jgi:hypothetical protein
MKTLSTAIVLIALLAVPAGVAAKPDQGDKRAAIAQCKSERGKTKATRKAFKSKYHSFSRCVRENTAEEAEERKLARENAAKQCKSEHAKGKNATKDRNAFGKCVSAKARALNAQQEARLMNAARTCKAERAANRESFVARYGGRAASAFGRCVSSKNRRP